LVNKTFPLTFPAFVATGFAPYAAIEYVYTYAQYGCPARRGLLGAAARGISAYAYEFAHTPSCSWFPGQDLSAEDLAGLGPAHTAELPFVFGHTSGLPAPNGNCSFTPAEKAISSSMVAAWTAMAATGSPSRHNAAWPAWNASAGLGWLVNTTATPGVVDFAPCALFDAVIALNGGVSDAKLGSL
jgi:carboxylesterase type B